MYRESTTLPPVGRRPKRPKNQAGKSRSRAVGLSRSLDQSLQRKLYSGLFQGSTAPPLTGPISRTDVQSSFPGSVGTAEMPVSGTRFSGIMVRKIELLLGESVSHAFSPEEGLVSEPPDDGRVLVLTNRRIIAFGQTDAMRQTVLMPVEEVKAVVVNVGHRSKATLLQGGLMVVAAVFFYVLLAYWLTGRIDGPTVPIIRMDLVAFVVFLAVLTGVAMLAQVYFSKPDGEVTFQGDGVKLTFPFKGESAEGDIYEIVNTAFAARQTVVGDSSPAMK